MPQTILEGTENPTIGVSASVLADVIFGQMQQARSRGYARGQICMAIGYLGAEHPACDYLRKALVALETGLSP